jgi:hypothetical protein
MNTKEIMELIADYQTAVENLADYEARWAYIEPDMFQHKFDSYAALRTAIEELAADAEKYGELAVSAANFMLGMTFDSRLPEDIRFAVLSKIAAIDADIKEST